MIEFFVFCNVQEAVKRNYEPDGTDILLLGAVNHAVRANQMYLTKADSAEDFFQHQSSTKALEQLLINSAKNENTFYGVLCRYIDRRGFKSDAEFYNMLNIPRQIFSRLRSGDKVPSKQNVLLMIAGLKLGYEQAVELLNLAGYAFRKSEKRDIIISYVIQNYDYDIDFIDDLLIYCGEKPLRGVRGDFL